MTLQHSPQLSSLCVFCGSSPGGDPIYRDGAERLGRLLAAEGITLVFGGGHMGMMGVLAEAALHAGGRVVGVIPDHLMRIEVPSRELSELIVVDSMHTRKRRMFDMADAFCVLPGGMGTMDETFEVLTWKQLRLHSKPVIVANLGGYWDRWLNLIDGIVGEGFAQPEVSGLFSVVETVDEVVPMARRQFGEALVYSSRLF